MKNILVVIGVLFTSLCHAQTSKGTIYAAGFGTYSYRKLNTENWQGGSSEQTTQNVLLGPSVGYFPWRKLLVGAELSLLSVREKASYISQYISYDAKSTSYNAGPFIRYYTSGGLYFYGSYFWGSVSEELETVTGNPSNTDRITSYNEQTVKLKGYSIGPGYSLFLNSTRKVALDMMVVYQSYDFGGGDYKGFGVGLGVSAFLFKTEE